MRPLLLILVLGIGLLVSHCTQKKEEPVSLPDYHEEQDKQFYDESLDNPDFTFPWDDNDKA